MLTRFAKNIYSILRVSKQNSRSADKSDLTKADARCVVNVKARCAIEEGKQETWSVTSAGGLYHVTTLQHCTKGVASGTDCDFYASINEVAFPNLWKMAKDAAEARLMCVGRRSLSCSLSTFVTNQSELTKNTSDITASALSLSACLQKIASTK